MQEGTAFGPGTRVHAAGSALHQGLRLRLGLAPPPGWPSGISSGSALLRKQLFVLCLSCCNVRCLPGWAPWLAAMFGCCSPRMQGCMLASGPLCAALRWLP
jgi:hypothetical protein